ncbi:cadmium-containing carbonic anhydrase [Nitrosomonas sp. Is37]|uniref:cadmium-containing carbonic anhydrase n=1 Tax=Nitrosomonas sp. Is37 TaxID=3080535 RepID=UPI00294AC807|nr:cadmium-containing carbonic anhydrase [Nitrosomonas sp. Is37]MDV6345470.1 cadmium-containing carbonic anhydrase [Nitrosomonas sp. Is37]
MFKKLRSMLRFLGSDSKLDSDSKTGLIKERNNITLMTQFRTLGNFNLGMGKIGPGNRVDIDQKILNEMYERVATGEFNISVNGNLPEICVDGRTDKNGSRKRAPSAAGGTLSMVYGVDLGDSESFGKKTELELTAEVMDILKNKKQPTGVHGDDHSNCGCGACSKAPDIYHHIVKQIDSIAALTSNYGISISDTEKAYVTEKATKRLNQSGFFAEDRSIVLQTARSHGADYEELVDAHNELGIALNTKAGTTVDRAAIRRIFGQQYDLFVVDAWTFDNAARELKPEYNNHDIARISKAIAIQNVATASVLGHSSLPIIPIK